MLTLHPTVLEQNGKKQFVVLSYDEFIKIQEELQDFQDLKDLREAKENEQNVSALSLSDAKKEWGI